MFNFTTHLQDTFEPDYTQTLADNMTATQTLVTKLAQLGGESQLQMDLKERQQATTEVMRILSVYSA
jgi:hypothetical protein